MRSEPGWRDGGGGEGKALALDSGVGVGPVDSAEGVVISLGDGPEEGEGTDMGGRVLNAVAKRLVAWRNALGGAAYEASHEVSVSV